jgi:hypothetical protein
MKEVYMNNDMYSFCPYNFITYSGTWAETFVS